MKINERVSSPGEDSPAGGSCGISPEALSQLKGEFHDFVVGTRRRLSSVADQLREIDRERARLETQRSCDLTSHVQETQAPSVESTDVTPQQEGDISGDSLDESEADSIWNATGSSDEMEAATVAETNLTSGQETSEQVPHTQVQEPSKPDGQTTERFAQATKVKRQAALPSAVGRDSALDPIDTDSDPLERLNAIKARLAKQIERA